ncbi:MAG: hypothetical protein KIT27_03765 [Legionellales bacterium]|nr:hypothetical protein [Legionellales bacterium]
MAYEFYPSFFHDIKLTQQQQLWWLKYLELLRTQSSQQQAVRELTAAILRENLYIQERNSKLAIVVAGRCLREFNSQHELNQYIHNLTRQGHSGDDAALNVVTHALGYQTITHLMNEALPPYAGFTQENYHGLRIDVGCFGTQSRNVQEGIGRHWELVVHNDQGQRTTLPNAGGGDCMFHMLAQQFQQDEMRVMQGLQQVAAPVATVPSQNSIRNASNAVLEEIEEAQTTNPVVSSLVDTWLKTVENNPVDRFAYLLFYAATGDLNLNNPEHWHLVTDTIDQMNSTQAYETFIRALQSNSSIIHTDEGIQLGQQLLGKMTKSQQLVCYEYMGMLNSRTQSQFNKYTSCSLESGVNNHSPSMTAAAG